MAPISFWKLWFLSGTSQIIYHLFIRLIQGVSANPSQKWLNIFKTAAELKTNALWFSYLSFSSQSGSPKRSTFTGRPFCETRDRYVPTTETANDSVQSQGKTETESGCEENLSQKRSGSSNKQSKWLSHASRIEHVQGRRLISGLLHLFTDF